METQENLPQSGRVILTSDGSQTIALANGITYHSKFGAIQESKHVFIREGFMQAMQQKNSLRVFEVGLGTGLNALLCCAFMPEGLSVRYAAVEAYPLEAAVYKQLHYCLESGDTKVHSYLAHIHEGSWGEFFELKPDFLFCKVHCKLQDFSWGADEYDLVFFDAFDPNEQPEMWTIEVFRQLHQHMADGGILVTYSCKGEVKRNMKAAGFEVYKIPGPPGKREMLRAISRKD